MLNFFEIGNDIEVSKKFMKSKSLCKEIEKWTGEIYINKDSVCLYNDSKIKKKIYIYF